ncbi:hypothetical protein IEQ34_022520 [Dendrobium chrysotoxum]|uniref:Uncharacterized protein n=1 Tax=Dendrobium chrysotoxum TaxID=161865 RepID=A0AAV7FXP9_DENCH|nr:hypothetical protein IEQ34_022520 [Dendrobium chrysotoxum]
MGDHAHAALIEGGGLKLINKLYKYLLQFLFTTLVPLDADMSSNARIIHHVLRTLIIPKAGDHINLTPLLYTVTYLIMTNTPIDEAQLIMDYIYKLSDIGLPHNRRKKNVALGHLVAYILEKKYNLIHHDPPTQLPIYFTDAFFRALFGWDQGSEGEDLEGEEGAPAPAPAPGPDQNFYQEIVQSAQHLAEHCTVKQTRQHSECSTQTAPLDMTVIPEEFLGNGSSAKTAARQIHRNTYNDRILSFICWRRLSSLSSAELTEKFKAKSTKSKLQVLLKYSSGLKNPAQDTERGGTGLWTRGRQHSQNLIDISIFTQDFDQMVIDNSLWCHSNLHLQTGTISMVLEQPLQSNDGTVLIPSLNSDTGKQNGWVVKRPQNLKKPTGQILKRNFVSFTSIYDVKS